MRARRILDSDARPQHLVAISRPFWLGKNPVTVGEYAAFVAEDCGRSAEPWASPPFPQDDRHPVVNVSHQDALAYLAWLGGKTDATWRLPSEAEWEDAARAGTTTARDWGDAAGEPGEHAHFSRFRDSAGGTRAVGGFWPNPFGLHDMLGNVWEWTADTWHDHYVGAPTDGSAWTNEGALTRIVRGGSWVSGEHNARASVRSSNAPSDRRASIGFRCARVHL